MVLEIFLWEQLPLEVGFCKKYREEEGDDALKEWGKDIEWVRV